MCPAKVQFGNNPPLGLALTERRLLMTTPRRPFPALRKLPSSSGIPDKAPRFPLSATSWNGPQLALPLPTNGILQKQKTAQRGVSAELVDLTSALSARRPRSAGR